MKKTAYCLFVGGLLLAGCATTNKTALITPAPGQGGSVVVKSSLSENIDPYTAGRTAAEALAEQLNGAAPHAILLLDCFETVKAKKNVIKGVSSVFDSGVIFGGAVYGMYTQSGATDIDGVALLALAGDGLQVQAALVEALGASTLSLETEKEKLVAALNAGGKALAEQIDHPADSTLTFLMGDAHSPKNQHLLDGYQMVAGKKTKVTGGSISKNDGLNYVYYRGRLYRDSAIAVAVKGGFNVAQTGRQAKSNDAVIATADEGSKTAMQGVENPFGIIAFDCAGRMGKLDSLDDELKAIQANIGREATIFGCYCAGEFGPADTTIEKADSVSKGRGWHVMFSVLGK